MFYKQLKKACKMRKTSITAVLKQIGIGTANGTYWKNGSIPSSDIVIKLAEFLNVSTDYLLLGKETNESKKTETSNSSPKFIDNATYNGTVNKMTGDYTHQDNYIGIQKGDLPNKETANDVVVELNNLICLLDDNSMKDMKELLIEQVRNSIKTFRQLSESNKKKQN